MIARVYVAGPYTHGDVAVNFTNEQWRELLRIIVRTIIFHGSRVTIQGKIPVSSSETGAGADVLLAVPLA